MNKTITGKAIFSLVLGIFFGIFFMAKLFSENANPIVREVLNHFTLAWIVSSIILFLLQMYIPWFEKHVFIMVLSIFFIVFLLGEFEGQYSKSICHQLNGDWKKDSQEPNYISGGGRDIYGHSDQSGDCYVSKDGYEKFSKDHPFLNSNFTRFQIKN